MPEAIVLTQTVTPHPLGTPAEMGEALAWAVTVGYRGHIQAAKDPNSGLVVWVIELNADTGTDQCIAPMGDVLLWDGKTMTSIDADDFAARAGA